VREVGDRVLFLHRLQPGGADRSYGIEVGKLAGLPEAVIARARDVLRLLEGEAERMVPSLTSGTIAVRGGRRAGGLAASTDQLGLFTPTLPHPVVERLRDTDVNSLTPLAALQLLAELAERARDA
jgi:DNA mismatch repair protein MutS